MREDARRGARRRAAVALLAAGLAATVAASPPAEEESVARGRLLYRISCASCHGAAAEGDGPVAEVLEPTPSDLTRIAVRREGRFPAEAVARVIDGREEVRGHGARTMPVWGVTFQDLGRDDDRQEEVEAKIEALVAYLRSIQVEVEVGPSEEE